MIKRLLATLGVGGMLVAASVAAASALQVNGPDGNLITHQAGVASDFSCDEDGVIAQVLGVELDDQTVRNLVVSDIDEACEGATLGYKVEDSEGGILAQGDAIIDGTTVEENVGPVSIQDIESIVIVIMGGDTDNGDDGDDTE